ncbi:MAG: PHP domain-containing protein [Candidatus Aenigmarchaeota archaeon]|nr:PHP domain-containing protein [Candidatus Aenigmarchaeota archaeon]
MNLKIDMHVHSCYSKDGFEQIKDIIAEAKRKGLDGIALTDHNTQEGVAEAKKEGVNQGIVVISGIEIKTEKGDVLAYGITKTIKKGMSVEKTICAIHKAEGLAVAAHPFPEPAHRTKMHKFLDVGFDIIETANARSLFMNKKAKKMAQKLNIPQTGGSDAHSLKEIGNAYTEISASGKNEKSILDALRLGNTTAVVSKNTSIYSFIYCTIKRIAKKC